MISDSPLVSIIIPLYNREKYIEETLTSLQSQSHLYWEALVVDDGSTDKSIERVSHMSRTDDRIKLLVRARGPKGANTCRNMGLENAAGKYVIFLDSDDLLAPFCLQQRLAKCAQNPGLDLLVFPMLWFKKHFYDLNLLQNVRTDEPDLDRFLRRDMVWLICSPIWKRSSLLAIGGFDETLSCFQESELHTRALLSGLKYEFFDKETPDCFYRVESEGTISDNRFSAPKYLESQIGITEKFIHLLAEQKALTQKRKEVFAGILLRISYSWMIIPNLEKKEKKTRASSTWQLALSHKLLPSMDYVFGKLYVKLKFGVVMSNFSFLRKMFESAFTGIFLKKYFNAPLSHTGKVRYETQKDK